MTTSHGDTPADQVRVARIGKPHGIKGEVTLEIFTDDPETRFTPGNVLTTSDGTTPAELTVASARWNKKVLLVKFEEVADRNMAETLRNTQLYAEPIASEDDEEGWYEQDLIGLQITLNTVDGQPIGTVTGLTTGPVQDLLHIKLTDSAEETLVPFVEDIVPEIDEEAGIVVLTPPLGLLELNQDN